MQRSDLRFHWASSLVQVEPDSRILEIGCGAGLLIEKMAENLQSGKITAIDKSPVQMAKAAQRNALSIEQGKVQLIQTDFIQYQGPENIFDRVVAFNVNLFLRQATNALQKVRSLISSTGQFILFYQFPYPVDISAAEPIIEELEANRFKIIRKSIKKFDPTPAFCIVAARGR
jgi:cyclopropane fatty-acyl-phospholipid synthase-like methyltransferase